MLRVMTKKAGLGKTSIFVDVGSALGRYDAFWVQAP